MWMWWAYTHTDQSRASRWEGALILLVIKTWLILSDECGIVQVDTEGSKMEKELQDNWVHIRIYTDSRGTVEVVKGFFSQFPDICKCVAEHLNLDRLWISDELLRCGPYLGGGSRRGGKCPKFETPGEGGIYEEI